MKIYTHNNIDIQIERLKNLVAEANTIKERKIRVEKLAQEIPPVTPAAIGQNPLNGKSNEQAKRIVRNLVDKPSKGLFSDETWEGPRNVFLALQNANIDFEITKNEYGVSPSHQSTWTGEKWKIPNDYKMWKFIVKFTNNKNKETIIYCTMNAHGAGSVQSPLDKYDMSVIIG